MSKLTKVTTATVEVVQIKILVIGGIPLVTSDAAERKAIKQNYQCSACRRLLIKPVRMDVMHQSTTTTECRHIFCQSCVSRAINKSRTESTTSTTTIGDSGTDSAELGLPFCLQCNRHTRSLSIVRERNLEDEIKQLLVTCRFHKYGCMWMHQFGTFGKHFYNHLDTCLYRSNCTPATTDDALELGPTRVLTTLSPRKTSKQKKIY